MNIPPSRDATEIVTACLVPGEQLLWAGRPKQGFALRGQDLFFILFMTVMVMVATWIIMDMWRQLGVASLPYSLLFLLPPVGFTPMRYWFDAKLRGRTFYGVTNRRAILVTYWLRQDMSAIDLKNLRELRLTRRWDETGTLEFIPTQSQVSRLWGGGLARYDRGALWMPGAGFWRLLTPLAFEMIADPLEVEQLILKARDEARAPAAMV